MTLAPLLLVMRSTYVLAVLCCASILGCGGGTGLDPGPGSPGGAGGATGTGGTGGAGGTSGTGGTPPGGSGGTGGAPTPGGTCGGRMCATAEFCEAPAGVCPSAGTIAANSTCAPRGNACPANYNP